MQRSEGAGLGLSVVGHIGLLALLSLNLMSVRELPKLSQPMDVMLVDQAGLVSAAPQASQEAPQAAEAPEVGPTTEEAPPPEPTATPRPTPPRPAPSSKVMADPLPPAPAKPKPRATSLGTDFLKGIPATKSTGAAEAPRVAAISPIAMNGLVQQIASQVRPCYTIPAGGTDIVSIVSRIRLRLKKDGSIAVAPEVVGNIGVNGGNQPYVRQMNEAAVRALQRCAPYKLDADLFEYWKDINFTFRPMQMN